MNVSVHPWESSKGRPEEMRPHVLFDDLDDMVRRVELYLDTPELVQRMKPAARRVCVTELSLGKYVEQIVDDAERLLGI
jgi:glycosyltransferase involved in cell wall biosynthesis